MFDVYVICFVTYLYGSHFVRAAWCMAEVKLLLNVYLELLNCRLVGEKMHSFSFLIDCLLDRKGFATEF